MAFMALMILLGMGVLAVVALVVVFMLLLPLQLTIKPKGANRYGPGSSTRDIGRAISSGFRRCFDFSGRANLVDFWVFAVTIGALCFASFAAFVVAAIVWRAAGWPWTASPLAVIPVLAVPSLSMAVRRLHDVNRSGWWLLVLCVAGILNLLYWFVQPSQSDAEEKAQVFA